MYMCRHVCVCMCVYVCVARDCGDNKLRKYFFTFSRETPYYTYFVPKIEAMKLGTKKTIESTLMALSKSNSDFPKKMFYLLQ